MIFRTDLITEAAEADSSLSGIKSQRISRAGVKGNIVDVLDQNNKIGKKAGRYVSFESDAVLSRNVEEYIKISKAISEELKKLVKADKKKAVLVVGLGNENMTPDSIGPLTVKGILVTRHIFEFLPGEADERMNSVCAVSPGVLGVTGIESADIIKGIVQRLNVGCVIVIDALASRRSERMFSTFQMTDTGIEPGAGVGNKRSALTRETLGVPVIAIGVPTVVYASSLVYDAAVEMLSGATGGDEKAVENAAKRIASYSGEDMVVTPKEIDVIAQDTAKILSDGINLALHDNIPLKEIQAYMF
ncbi:MAG: GPR endopeptidase [Clostridia bacterium]|jgi:spore protease|nr:GPR endopeptidase [Clostridia bacterium]